VFFVIGLAYHIALVALRFEAADQHVVIFLIACFVHLKKEVGKWDPFFDQQFGNFVGLFHRAALWDVSFEIRSLANSFSR
jgi:hypothetical protein